MTSLLPWLVEEISWPDMRTNVSMNCRLITSVLLLFNIGTTLSTFTNEFVANIEGGPEVADSLAASYGFINLGEVSCHQPYQLIMTMIYYLY